MKRKLIITKDDKNRIISSVFEDNQMTKITVEPLNKESMLGNIYVGKVQNIVKNINAAFIEIKDSLMCYYSLAENTLPIYVKKIHTTTDKLCIGDEILVQIQKDSVKTKAPVVTSNLSFTGRFCVLTYGKTSVGISNKITDINEKNRLKSLTKPYLSKEYGFIVRTNAISATDEDLLDELKLLVHQYNEIKTFAIHKTCFSLVYQSTKSYLSEIRDSFQDSIDSIVIEDEEIYNETKEYLSNYQPLSLPKLLHYQDNLLSLDKLYAIQIKMDEALKQKVWLKSGGTIIIEPTEALVVIDVNTGKAIQGKKSSEETFLKINMEAAKEIARQIKLRNLSGIIIIDFIDLSSKENKLLLMDELKRLFSYDSVKTTVVDMTPLNLVEVTRKKIRKPLYEQIMDC